MQRGTVKAFKFMKQKLNFAFCDIATVWLTFKLQSNMHMFCNIHATFRAIVLKYDGSDISLLLPTSPIIVTCK